ncbi:MAG: hypothetical protein J7K26_02985 [Candidatus Aenigmarchaeota archaeon]|nr:hypothetical protein [Candidatus Aenigmarchaeota archaeon]
MFEKIKRYLARSETDNTEPTVYRVPVYREIIPGDSSKKFKIVKETPDKREIIDFDLENGVITIGDKK